MKCVFICHMRLIEGTSRWKNSLQRATTSLHSNSRLPTVTIVRFTLRIRPHSTVWGTKQRVVLPTLTPAWAPPWSSLTALMEINWIYLWSIGGIHQTWKCSPESCRSPWMDRYEIIKSPTFIWLPLRLDTKVTECDMTSEITYMQVCGLSGLECISFTYGPFKQWGGAHKRASVFKDNIDSRFTFFPSAYRTVTSRPIKAAHKDRFRELQTCTANNLL